MMAGGGDASGTSAGNGVTRNRRDWLERRAGIGDRATVLRRRCATSLQVVSDAPNGGGMARGAVTAMRVSGSNRRRDAIRLRDQPEPDSALRKRRRASEASFDVWIEGKYGSFRDNRANNDIDGHFGLVSIGADYVLSRGSWSARWCSSTACGSARICRRATRAATAGWLGPYATVRLTDNLFWQGRAAWGAIDQRRQPLSNLHRRVWDQPVAPLLDAQRTLERGSVGAQAIGLGGLHRRRGRELHRHVRRVIPEVTIAARASQDGTRSRLPLSVQTQVVLEPHGGLQLISNFAGDTTVDGLRPDRRRERRSGWCTWPAEFGLRVIGVRRVRDRLSGSYDGLGVPDYGGVTGQATVRVPLK